MIELDGLPKRRARNAIDLCQVEWAWSPAHGRIDAYHLLRGTRDWLLWLGAFNDNESPWCRDWSIVAGVAHRHVDERLAAQDLLRAFWMYDWDQGDLGVVSRAAVEGAGHCAQLVPVQDPARQWECRVHPGGGRWRG